VKHQAVLDLLILLFRLFPILRLGGLAGIILVSGSSLIGIAVGAA